VLATNAELKTELASGRVTTQANQPESSLRRRNQKRPGTAHQWHLDVRSADWEVNMQVKIPYMWINLRFFFYR
jgi:hypothetical protein